MLDTSFLLWLQQWASPAFTEIVRAVSLWGLWLPRTSYVLNRLRLWAFSDSLQSCHPSSFRCSTRSDLSSQSRLSAAPGNHRSPTPAGRHQSITSPTSSSHVCRPPPVGWLAHAWRGWRTAVHIVTPETVVTWHRRGFRLFWTWKSRHRTGRPRVPTDVRALIRELSTANPLWGAPRIHGELLKLGIAVSQSTVAKYMRRHPRPPSQTWVRSLAATCGPETFPNLSRPQGNRRSA